MSGYTLSDNLRVLLVEDDDDILRIVEKYLEKWGFQVDAFGDPIMAWQHFQDHAENYSIVLSDIKMPGMTGLELAKLMKTQAGYQISAHDSIRIITGQS